MLIEGPERDVRESRGEVQEPADFDDFWSSTLAGARERESPVHAEEVEPGLTTVRTFDVRFAGFAGDPVRAWLRVPRDASTPLPVIVEFLGYGGGRGAITENLLWSAAGYAHLLVDTRGQGSSWSRGDTPDPHGSGPAVPGFLTRGIEDRDSYYYRRVFTDAVRAIDALEHLPLVDPERIAVLGGSQGGGIALAAAGLSDRVSALFARVPFLCDIYRAAQVTDSDPYAELARWLRQHRRQADAARNTLAYFDGVILARRATAHAWFSTALMDPICPPSTVFAAYNAYAGPKEITVWPFNGHEGGGPEDDATTIDALREFFR